MAYGAGVDVQKGATLIFDILAGIFGKLSAVCLIEVVFLMVIVIAVFSSIFKFIRIPVRTFEIKLRLDRKKVLITSSAIIWIGNILVSLGFGPQNNIKLLWPYFTGIKY